MACSPPFFADRSFPQRHGIARLGMTVASLLTALVLGASRADAQLDARALIGKAVDEVGPKHSDVEKAIERYRVRDTQGALEFLEAARRKDPNVPPAEIVLAKMHLAAGQTPAARTALEEVTEKYPNDPEPYLIFGERAFAANRLSDAQLLFAKGLQLASAYRENPIRRSNLLVRSHAGLASVAERREDWATAAEHLQQWVEEDPESATAKHRLGRSRFMLGDAREAYALFQEAAKGDTSLPSPAATIGALYEQRGGRSEATQLMERALRDDSASIQTLLAVARWQLETEQYAKAQTVLDAALRREPESLDALLLSGIVSRMLKNYDAAEDKFEQAHVLAPTNFDAMNQLALVLIEQSDTEKQQRAVQYGELNLRLHNNNPEAGVAVGWIYYQLGRTQDAERILNAALKAGRMGPDSSYFVAKIFFDRGLSSTAVSLLESALESDALFVQRSDAQTLLARIKRTSPATGAGE